MKPLIVILFFLNFGIKLFSQNYQVNYTTYFDGNEKEFFLIGSDSISQWNQIVDNESLDLNDFFVKNKKLNLVYYYDKLFTKSFYIKDTLCPMIWSLSNIQKTVLGKLCQSATTTVRGRTYTAFYSTEIQIADGPWKFCGLPGLVLFVESSDKNFSFEAKNITINKNIKIKNQPYLTKKFIAWEIFKKEFVSVFDNNIKLMKSNGTIDDGSKVKIKISQPEIIYPKIQQGDGGEF